MEHNKRINPDGESLTIATASTFHVWCDGSYYAGYGVGAWGAVIVYPNGYQKEHSGFLGECTTNQYPEITSILESLKLIPDSANVCIKNDCKNVVDSVIQALECKRKNRLNVCPRFFRSDTKLLDDIHRELDRLGRINVEWVKGHSKDVMNQRADRLAVAAVKDHVVRVSCNIKFNGSAYPHWRSYVAPISRILGKNRYALKPGDSRLLTKKLCLAGQIHARESYHTDNMPPDHVIFRAADRAGIRLLPPRGEPVQHPVRAGLRMS